MIWPLAVASDLAAFWRAGRFLPARVARLRDFLVEGIRAALDGPPPS